MLSPLFTTRGFFRGLVFIAGTDYYPPFLFLLVLPRQATNRHTYAVLFVDLLPAFGRG